MKVFESTKFSRVWRWHIILCWESETKRIIWNMFLRWSVSIFPGTKKSRVILVPSFYSRYYLGPNRKKKWKENVKSECVQNFDGSDSIDISFRDCWYCCFVSNNSIDKSNSSYFLSFWPLEKIPKTLQNKHLNMSEQTSQNK